MNTLKLRLHQLCLAYAEERIRTAKSAISASRESANDDTKSSAGDKYETSREMMQQDIARNTIQLAEAERLKSFLLRMQPGKAFTAVESGSLVYTDQGIFYIAISAGQVEFEGQNYLLVSAASPIGAKLISQKIGNRIEFNGRSYLIKEIQ